MTWISTLERLKTSSNRWKSIRIFQVPDKSKKKIDSVRCTPPQVKPKPGSSSKPHFQGVNPLLVLLHPGRSSPDNFFYHLCVKRCLWNRSWNWSSLCLQKGWWFLLRFRGKSEICRRSPWDFHKFQKWWSSDQVHAVTRQKITAFNERLGKQAVQKGFPPTRVTRGQRLDD